MNSEHLEGNANVTGDVLECHPTVSNIAHNGVQNDTDMLTKLSQDLKKKSVYKIWPSSYTLCRMLMGCCIVHPATDPSRQNVASLTIFEHIISHNQMLTHNMSRKMIYDD